jgi:hypothetical protein
MDKEIKPQCPLLKVACLGQGCAWYCVYDRGGAKETPQDCAIRSLAYGLKAISLRSK